MSQAKERIVSVQRRIETLLSGLDASASSSASERDHKVFRLLLSAAEYTAMADDIADSGHVLGLLLAGEAVEMPWQEDGDGEGEHAILLGISLGDDACGLIALPPPHIRNHPGACISPDPSPMFPGQDANRVQPDEQAEEKKDAKEPAAAGTTNGGTPPAQQFFQPSSSNPDEAVEELSIVLIVRAERLLDQAQQLKSDQPASQTAPALNCSTADFR